MNPAIELTLNQAFDFLLYVAVVRPVFLWGAPGIGKTALVNRFAAAVGLECVALLGSQLAPEDLLGVPKIDGDCSRFFPPPTSSAASRSWCFSMNSTLPATTSRKRSIAGPYGKAWNAA